MNNEYILYQHAGSGNHGCEALVRTVIKTIKSIDEDATFKLITSKIDEDIKYKIDKIENLEIISLNKEIKKFNFNWIKLQISKVIKNERMRLNSIFNLSWANNENATYIAIGGDNYCYNKGKNFYDVDNYIKGKKILWGCSIEPADLDEELINHLKKFDIITAREILTYDALINKGLDNVKKVYDTAFILDYEDIKISTSTKFIGINISPLIFNYCEDGNLILENYKNLVEFVLNDTNYSIILIPHVVSENNDDLDAINKLIKLFKEKNNRLILIEDGNCEKLKGYISHCDFFVGARTHSTIASYSLNIPTLVVGYSIKSKGIAKDLFGSYERYVVSVESMKNENELKEKFKLLQENQFDDIDVLLKKNIAIKNAIVDDYKQILNNRGDLVE